jgi:hypothetical protein
MQKFVWSAKHVFADTAETMQELLPGLLLIAVIATMMILIIFEFRVPAETLDSPNLSGIFLVGPNALW